MSFSSNFSLSTYGKDFTWKKLNDEEIKEKKLCRFQGINCEINGSYINNYGIVWCTKCRNSVYTNKISNENLLYRRIKIFD